MIAIKTYEPNIAATLAEREKRYGAFRSHAHITQLLKETMYGYSAASGETTVENEIRRAQWRRLSADKKEALEMIAHKIGRILNGDPNYADSWHDVVGYAKLVEDEINRKDM